METVVKKRLVFAFITYWFLLLYIVAALVWWFISLEKQNHQMADYQLHELQITADSTKVPEQYKKQKSEILDTERRNSAKYIGEGSTFLALILLGAVFVYRAVRRQINTQQQQQNFMMAVTHELKTPIAVAKLNLETLQKHQLDESKKQKIIAATLDETNRLNTLTNNILVSSQLEGGRYLFAKEELDFSELTKSAVADFKQRYPERQWIVEIQPDVDMTGDSLLLQIMVNNLLENAIKYSPKQKPVTCRLCRNNKGIELSILDEGPGVVPTERKRIFEKFYRAGNESTRTTHGTGLGLYLCRKIARDHNGDIFVTDNLPAGSNFTVHFNRGKNE